MGSDGALNELSRRMNLSKATTPVPNPASSDGNPQAPPIPDTKVSMPLADVLQYQQHIKDLNDSLDDANDKLTKKLATAPKPTDFPISTGRRLLQILGGVGSGILSGGNPLLIEKAVHQIGAEPFNAANTRFQQELAPIQAQQTVAEKAAEEGIKSGQGIATMGEQNSLTNLHNVESIEKPKQTQINQGELNATRQRDVNNLNNQTEERRLQGLNTAETNRHNLVEEANQKLTQSTPAEREKLVQMRINAEMMRHNDTEANMDKRAQSSLNKNVLELYKPAFDSKSRLDSMNESYKTAIQGDQQAQLNILANHIGMTFGLQKGIRATQAMINEAMRSSPVLAGLENKISDGNGNLEIKSGVTLTKPQLDQMMNLARNQFKIGVEKSDNEARFVAQDKWKRPDGLTSNNTPTGHQVGETIKLKSGKSAKITSINSDGSYGVETQ